MVAKAVFREQRNPLIGVCQDLMSVYEGHHLTQTELIPW